MADEQSFNNANSTSPSRLIIPDTGTLPLMLKVNQAGALLGIGRTGVYHLIEEGVLSVRKIGRSTRITTKSVFKAAGYQK